MRVFPSLVAAATLWAAAAGAPAQDRPPPIPLPPPPPAKDPNELKIKIPSPKGGYSVLDLLEAVNQQTGRSVIYDSKTKQFIEKAQVQFVGNYEVPRSKLFDWLQAVLAFSDFVLVPVGPEGYEQWMVVQTNNQLIKSRPTFVAETDLEQWKDRDGVYIVTTLRMRNVQDPNDVGRVRAALSALMSPTQQIGKVNEVPGQRALIVADFAPVVYATKKLLEAVDVSVSENELRLERVEVVYALASDLEGILSDLLAGSSAPGQPRPVPGQNPGSKPPAQIIADNRTNSLVLYAIPEDIDKIKSLIRQLDTPYRGKSRLRFRTLQYQEAEDVATLLGDLIRGTGAATTRPSSSSRSRSTSSRTRTAPNQPQAPGTPFGSGSENEPVIIPDDKSNSLIIHATDDQYADLEELIAKIDRPRKQVLIETALVELSLSDSLRVGADLFGVARNVAIDTNGDGVVDTFTDERSFFGISSSGVSSIVTQNVNGVDVPVATSPSIAQDGSITAGIINNGRIPFILQALQTSAPTKILTMPSVVTSDNQRAIITTEDALPYPVTTFVGPNQTPTQSFESATATNTLEISPSISADDFLRLDIHQVVSSLRAIPGSKPASQKREIQTNLMVPNNATVVLGGIVSTQESENASGVPFLMDIPLLGYLFRSKTTTTSRTNLFLFVTPRIMKDLTTFTDYHSLTWEKKLLQDKLFGKEVEILGSRFVGEGGPRTAIDAVRRIEDSGALDAWRYKEPPSQAERVEDARRSWEEMQRRKAEEEKAAGTPPGGAEPGEKPPERPAGETPPGPK